MPFRDTSTDEKTAWKALMKPNQLIRIESMRLVGIASHVQLQMM